MTRRQLSTINEAEAVDTIVRWIDLVAAMLTTDAAHIVLRDHIRHLLRSGAVTTMKVIEAARAGHHDADLALRELGVEMMDRSEMPPAALRAYLQEALIQPPVSRDGRLNITDLWLRDVAVAVLVAMAVERWQLKATRNRASTWPSACSLVAAALYRCGIEDIGELHVERIYANHGGPRGPAARLSASVPLADAYDSKPKSGLDRKREVAK